jgi:hypothetical protein
MPTATKNLDARVTNPLDALRGTIRRYVVIEGVLAAAVLLVAWFALGLALDYGVFKATSFSWFGAITPFSWDWAQDAPWWFRLVALVAALGLLAYIVARRIVYRLTKELSYPALALVLERRFPALLGDRLITAVELADIDAAAKYGYSREMIAATIAEANERVGKVPVKDVFNWHRLWVMGYIAAGLLAALVVVAFAFQALGTGSASPQRFGWRFAHTTGIFFERNVLLQDTPWPRQAHLELVEFPGDEMKIAKDAPAPRVRVRASRWVVAAPGTRDGWRAMLWSDVTPDLVGTTVPDMGATVKKPTDPATLTVDAVDVAFRDAPPDLRERLKEVVGSTTHADLMRTLDSLDALADNPAMARKVRKLAIPDALTLSYAGATVEGSSTLNPEGNHEFATKIEGLKETVEFGVRAADFRTATRAIKLVPAPLIRKLAATQFQPAYLHHAPPQDQGYPALAGLRQRLADRDLALTGKKSLFSVPTGTELVLTATTDKEITAAWVIPKIGKIPGAAPGSPAPVPLPVAADKSGFVLEFRGDNRLTSGVEFNLEFTDTDGVKNYREMQIQVAEDQPPVVEVQLDVVRKVEPFYYITPRAKVPFDPVSVVTDDFGLSNLTYSYTYWSQVSDQGLGSAAGELARVFLDAPAPGRFTSGVLPAAYARFAVGPRDDKKPGSAVVKRFFDLKGGLKLQTFDSLKAALDVPADESRAEVVKQVELKSAAEDFFNVRALDLEPKKAGEVQQRFRIDLVIEATDTNYDTGPKKGRNLEPLKFLVVSEADLLAEISKEEVKLADKLDEALTKLAAAKVRYSFIGAKNAKTVIEELDIVKVRASDAGTDVAKARDVVQDVARAYRRITRECVMNDVTEGTTTRLGLFAGRMEVLLGEVANSLTDEERKQMPGQPKPRTTFPDGEKALTAVLNPLNENRWANPNDVTTAQAQILMLEEEVTKLRKELAEKFDDTRLRRELQSTIEDRKRLLAEKTRWQELAGRLAVSTDAEVTAIGPQFLAKGEAKKFRHPINWRQYKGPPGKEDELIVKVAASDKSLTVPAELKLDFERDQQFFEYEVRAGNVAGEFTVTVTPQPGQPVVVTVTVK